MRPIGGAVAALLTAAAAAPASADVADCIDLSRVTGPDVRGDGTILYRQNGRLAWRALVQGRCPPPRQGARLVVTSFAGQRLCRGDRFRALDSWSSVPGPACRFGGFVPSGIPAR